jgi:hypothetical protein
MSDRHDVRGGRGPIRGRGYSTRSRRAAIKPRARPARRRQTTDGKGRCGCVLPIAGFGGIQLALVVEPVAEGNPGAALVVFRVAFVLASAAVAFVCTVVTGWLLGARGALRSGVSVAVGTALTYLVVALAFDPIPGLHVGGGDRAMPKVAAICNLAAGFVGGITAFHTLLGAPHRRLAAGTAPAAGGVSMTAAAAAQPQLGGNA